MAGLRKDVLKCFKSLLRTSRTVFREDAAVQEKARQEIRKEFLKNRGITDPKEVAKLLQVGYDVKVELETSVACMELNPVTGNYELRINNSHLSDNAPWPPPPPSSSSSSGRNRKSTNGCCGAVPKN